MAEDEVEALLKALKRHGEDQKDSKLLKLLERVADGLEKVGDNTAEDRAARKRAEEDEELAKLFPALRSRGYGNKLTFRSGSPLLGEGPPNTKDSPPGYGS
jgi:hypothetical protein